MPKMITIKNSCYGEVNVQLSISDECAKAVAERHKAKMVDFHEDIVVFADPTPGGGFINSFAVYRRDDGQMVVEVSEFEHFDPLDGTTMLPLDDLDFILSCAEKFRHILGVSK